MRYPLAVLLVTTVTIAAITSEIVIAVLWLLTVIYITYRTLDTPRITGRPHRRRIERWRA